MKQTGSIKAASLTAAFASDALQNASVTNALAALHEKYARFGARMQNDMLVLRLNPLRLAYGADLIDAVEKLPALKDRILFADGKNVRIYDHVVWDVQTRGLELARSAFREKNGGQPVRIIISTPVKGSYVDSPRAIECGFIPVTGKHGPLSIQPVIEATWPAAKKAQGARVIIQTNDIRADYTDAKSVLKIRIGMNAALYHDMAPKVDGAPHELHA